jgi:hypothetical protein
MCFEERADLLLDFVVKGLVLSPYCPSSFASLFTRKQTRGITLHIT